MENLTFVCNSCGSVIPSINKIIHEVRCKGKRSREENDIKESPDTISSNSTNAPKNAKQDDKVSGESQESSASEYWECSMCSLHNPLSSNSCEVCLHERINSHSSSDTWACTYCSFQNDSTLHRCNMCGGHRRDIDGRVNSDHALNSDRSGPERGWKCDACTVNNDPTNTLCQVCGVARPPDRSYRDTLIPDQTQHQNIYQEDLNISHQRPPSTYYEPPPSCNNNSINNTYTNNNGGRATSRNHLNSFDNLTTGMTLGALGGLGFALLTGRDTLATVANGAAIGAMTASLCNTFMPPPNNTSNQNNYQRYPHDTYDLQHQHPYPNPPNISSHYYSNNLNGSNQNINAYHSTNLENEMNSNSIPRNNNNFRYTTVHRVYGGGDGNTMGPRIIFHSGSGFHDFSHPNDLLDMHFREFGDIIEHAFGPGGFITPYDSNTSSSYERLLQR